MAGDDDGSLFFLLFLSQVLGLCCALTEAHEQLKKSNFRSNGSASGGGGAAAAASSSSSYIRRGTKRGSYKNSSFSINE